MGHQVFERMLDSRARTRSVFAGVLGCDDSELALTHSTTSGVNIAVMGLDWQPGDRLIDLSGNIPHGARSIDFVVSLEPFYTRFYIYQPGFPDSIQQCCSSKSTAVLRIPVIDGRYCVRQSQPQMKWTVRVLLKPAIEM